MPAIVRVLAALLAFVIAYAGQRLLQDRRAVTTGFAYMAVAAGVLIATSLRRKRLPVAESAPGTPDAGDGMQRLATVIRWGLLLAACVVGVAYRFYLLDSDPWGVWFDEAQNGLVAQRILNDPDYRPVFVGDLSQLPALFFYVFAASIKLFGLNVWAVRLVTTIAGILTLPFTYLLALELFGAGTAVFATLLLAVMRWHVNFSRFGMQGIFMPLFMTATMYFLVRGLKGKRLGNFAAAGLMAGIGLQGYYSFLLVPVVVLLVLLHYAIFDRVVSWGRLIAGTLLLGMVTAAVYSPVAIYAMRNPAVFNQRLGTVTITRGRTTEQVIEVLQRTVEKHLLMFNVAGDGNGRHNLPGHPMLDPYTGFLFVLGVGCAAWRWRQSASFLPLVWVAVVLQAGIWSLEFEAPQGYRTIGVTPAAALLAALPLGWLWGLVERAWPQRETGRLVRLAGYASIALAAVTTVAILAAAAYSNFDTYFRRQLRRADVWASYSADATFAGLEIARLGGTHRVYCSPFLAGLPTITFLAPNSGGTRRFEAAQDLPLTEPQPSVFLLSYSERPAFELLKTYYPNAKFVEFGPPEGGAAIMLEAILTSEDIAATRGLTYTLRGRGGSRDGRVDSLQLDWTQTLPLPPPFDAEWSGLLKVPRYGSYVLEAHVPGSAELSLDGHLVAHGDATARTAPVTLAQGLHEIRLRGSVRTPGSVQLLWQSEGSTLRPVSGTQLFSAPITRQGLEGSYFSDAGGRSDLKFVRIDPFPGGHMHILPLSPPFTIRWRGQLTVPSGGLYRLIVQAVDAGDLSVDGKHLITTPGPNQPAEATTALEVGAHAVEIEYRQRGGSPSYINVLWDTPDAGPQPIPAGHYAPPS